MKMKLFDRVGTALVCCFKWLFLLMFLIAAPVSSEQLEPVLGDSLYGITKHHALKPGETSKTWEYIFRLPEGNPQGSHWKRYFRTDGSLVVEEEAMSHGAYYVKVRLLDHHGGARRGSLHVWARRMSAGPEGARPVSPNISFQFPKFPEFGWEEPMETLSVALYDRKSGESLHQRIYSDVSGFGFEDELFEIGGEYLLIISQSDEWGRYSTPIYAPFSVDLVEIKCGDCNGSGIGGSNGSGGSTPGICVVCSGTGVVSYEEYYHDDMKEIARWY